METLWIHLKLAISCTTNNLTVRGSTKDMATNNNNFNSSSNMALVPAWAGQTEEKGVGDGTVEIGEDSMEDKEVLKEERLAPALTSVEDITEHETTPSFPADESEPTIQQSLFKIDPKSNALSTPETDPFRSPTIVHILYTQNRIAFTPPSSEDGLERQCCFGPTIDGAGGHRYESSLSNTSTTAREEIGVDHVEYAGRSRANGDYEGSSSSENLYFGERKQLRRHRRRLWHSRSLGSIGEMPEVVGGDYA